MAKDRAAGGHGGVEKGSPTGDLSPPPWCFQPGCGCLAEPSRPLSAEGRDCRMAECNQSREETNNLRFPPSGASEGAVLLFSERWPGLPAPSSRGRLQPKEGLVVQWAAF